MAKRFWDTSSFSGVFVRNLTLGVLKLTRQNTLINTALTRFLPIPSEQSWLVTPNTVQGEGGQRELYFPHLKHKVSLTFWPQEEHEWHHSDPLAARKMPVVRHLLSIFTENRCMSDAWDWAGVSCLPRAWKVNYGATDVRVEEIRDFSRYAGIDSVSLLQKLMLVQLITKQQDRFQSK